MDTWIAYRGVIEFIWHKGVKYIYYENNSTMKSIVLKLGNHVNHTAKNNLK